jgi:hypothetical protein
VRLRIARSLFRAFTATIAHADRIINAAVRENARLGSLNLSKKDQLESQRRSNWRSKLEEEREREKSR